MGFVRYENPVYVGIDVGASRTKAAVIDSGKKLIGFAVEKSGTDYSLTAKKCFDLALAASKLSLNNVRSIISTGYGRKNISFSDGTKTEISCHGKGAFHFFPMEITIIDIGGQDNKIIRIDEDGNRLNFRMNRKCAAGTGAFLEEMSSRLDIPLENMDSLARQSLDMVELGSYCTVFSATEVLAKIRQGKKIPDIIKGLYFSVIKRVLEMDSLGDNVVMTGGVAAYNPFLVKMTEEITGRKILLPEQPQLTGAIGAALYAMNS